MNALMPLHFDRFDVRMDMRGNVPWWVLNDLCIVAGFASPRVVAARLHDWQKDYVWIPDAIGRQRKTLVVNEAGIYGMMLGSNKPEAEGFARWLFTEVIPSIRIHGKYPPDPEPELVALPAPVEFEDRQHDRFLQEWNRISQIEGAPSIEELSHLLPKNTLTTMERRTCNFRDWMGTNNRWDSVLSLGMDLNYIMRGERSLTPPA